jgi:mono/diheme cytochrome c family protein
MFVQWLVALCIVILNITTASADDQLAHGEYLVKLAQCGACHGKNIGDPKSPLSGGFKIKDEFGNVFVPNITPSNEYGIGNWGTIDISIALRSSLGLENKKLSISSHEGFRWMSDEDVNSISKFLKSLPAEGTDKIERRDLGGMKTRSWGLIEKHDEVKGYVPAPVRSASGYYGLYLVNNVMACSRCHSPKNRSIDDEKYLAGGELDWYSLSGEEVKIPSIRYNETGIGSWSEKELETFLKSGIKKNSQKVSKECPQEYFGVLNEQDSKAVISYLKSLK